MAEPLTQRSPGHRASRRKVLTGLVAGGAVVLAGAPLRAQGAGPRMPQGLRFASIDGGEVALDDWAGRPVLVVNTASRCAFTGQYAALQDLYDTYRAKGLIVLAVPSDDFRQELDSAAAIKAFCEMTFGLDLPMTDITSVRGRRAHPLYGWLRAEHGVAPRWNFTKVLLSAEGRFVDSWGSSVAPNAPVITRAIEAALVSS